jgi:acyl-CoA thioester hydrolase
MAIETQRHSAVIELEPAFHDIDPMNVVWHGRYVQYLELARCALLRTFDYDYPQMCESGFAWPVVDMRLRYARPLRYGQRVAIRATVVEWENRLKIDYEVRALASGERLTRAYTVQVAVEIASGEMRYVCPDVLLQKLGVLSA